MADGVWEEGNGDVVFCTYPCCTVVVESYPANLQLQSLRSKRSVCRRNFSLTDMTREFTKSTIFLPDILTVFILQGGGEMGERNITKG